MGHSFTTFRNKRILCKDFKLETWLHLICREIDAMEKIPEWLKKAKKIWFNEVKFCINGGIDPNFDKLLDSEEKVILMIEICEKVNKKLKSFGEKVPAAFLNELYGIRPDEENRIKVDNETEIYLHYGRALLRLLKKQQESDLEMA